MKSWIFIGILIALLGGAAYYYYSTTQTRIQGLVAANATLEANIVTLRNANQTNLDTIDKLQNEFTRVRENYERVSSEFQVIRSQNNELRERLSRHDLGALAEAKPGLIERAVNNATQDAARCFELMSGAPLNERELSATSSSEFNTECPWMMEELR